MGRFGRIIAGAVLALGLSNVAAHAIPILGFSYQGGGTPVVGTRTGSTTTITANNIGVTISSIDSATPMTVPTNAFLTLNFTSTGAASTMFGNIVQSYSGTFSITNGSTNYLSGFIPDLAFGSGSQFNLTGSTPSDAVTFTSNVIADLDVDRSAGFTFTGVTPQLHIANGTIDSFSAAISGNFSAEPFSVPEPASLTLVGLGLVAVGVVRRRRQG